MCVSSFGILWTHTHAGKFFHQCWWHAKKRGPSRNWAQQHNSHADRDHCVCYWIRVHFHHATAKAQVVPSAHCRVAGHPSAKNMSSFCLLFLKPFLQPKSTGGARLKCETPSRVDSQQRWSLTIQATADHIVPLQLFLTINLLFHYGLCQGCRERFVLSGLRLDGTMWKTKMGMRTCEIKKKKKKAKHS